MNLNHKVGDIVYLSNDAIIQKNNVLCVKATIDEADAKYGLYTVTALDRKGFGGQWTEKCVFATRAEAMQNGREVCAAIMRTIAENAAADIAGLSKMMVQK